MKKPRWTAEDDALLKKVYPTGQRAAIEHSLGKPWEAIKRRALRLSLRRGLGQINKDRVVRGKRKDAWTEEEDTLLREIYSTSTKEEITSKIHRSWMSIRNRAYVQNLKRSPAIVKEEMVAGGKKAPPSQMSWTNTQIEALLRLYPSSPKRLVMEEVGKTWKATRAKALSLGINRDPELIKRENVEATSNAMYQKYGVKYSTQLESMKEKSKQTNIERRGCPYPSQSKAVQEKIKSAVKKRFGVNNVFQAPSVKDKIKETLLEKYGVENPMLSTETLYKSHQKVRDNTLFALSAEESVFYTYLKKIDPETECQVWNPVVGNTIDFYIPSFNLWVQYDGSYWHGKNIGDKNGPRAEKIRVTVKRDTIQNNLIPNLVRFSSDELMNYETTEDLLNFISGKLEEKSHRSFVSHQYIQKQRWKEEDLKSISFDPSKLSAKDIALQNEPYSTEISAFIKKYEWLMSVGTTPKWCFAARYEGTLAGVVLLNEPNAYSKLLGDQTPRYECLIQRGATASWAPKNLGSRLIMFACRWMVKNSPKRLFIGYGDPKAREMGVIYQACNFDYLGNNFGHSFLYKNPRVKNGLPFSEQELKRTSAFRAWCKNSGIPIQQGWIKTNGFKDLSTIPIEIKERWYSYNKEVISQSEKIPIDKKHKYALILARDKRENRMLINMKTYRPKPYPKKANTKDHLNGDSSMESLRPLRAKKSPPPSSRRTPEKLKLVKEHFPTKTVKEISEIIGETERWVSGIVRHIVREGKLAPKNPAGSTRNRKTKFKIDYVNKNRGILSYKEMATQLCETTRWIKRIVNEINREEIKV